MLRRGRRIALLSVLGALGAAAPAHAGTYAVSACHMPGGAVAPLDGWSGDGFAGDVGAISARDECRGAGGMAIRFTPPSGSASGTWNLGDIAEWGFGAPDDTTLAALTLERTFSATGPSAVDWQVSGEGGYRFSGARGSFRVRGRVPSEAAYPFAPASSRAVRVRVR